VIGNPRYKFIHVAAMSACALLASFCSSVPERTRGSTACEFAPAQTLGPIVNSPKEEGSPTVSSDETKLFFTSGRNGQEDLFVSMRPRRESPWGEPANLGDSVNDSMGDDFALRLAMNGLALYFASNRAGGFGTSDLYVTTRDSLDHEWGRATNLGSVVNTAAFEAFPTPSPDGNTLYFNRSTTFDSQDSDIWVTSRSDAHSPWAAPQKLGMSVNGPRAEFSPSISSDGLSLYFASDRDGNLGSIDIWVSTRERATDAWGVSSNLGANINAAGAMTLAPFITSNNRALYFMSARPDTSGASPCTPQTCFERLDLYVAVASCRQ
jgi:Tol biopolymer transport system component